ncbi:MAG: OB-fold nucleic acid binding domain-containing protein, partial [Gammaproteobacteria bacterium]|nr:OB-fold nucleic acid binding domain-containing protein [Gammaproteobacteria bacterium]
VIVYQEQVMQIAQVLAGYSLGQADMLRRAMGKKKPEEMAKERAIFMAGAERRQVDPARAEFVFDLMEKFAGYGFNKSHSVAYALLSYQTAWLKAHYPAAFLAAALSCDMDNTDRVVLLIDEARRMEVVLEPPNVDLCDYRFVASQSGSIRYGLGAVKGVGQSAIESLVEARQAKPYGSLFDFVLRVDSRRVTRRALESLVRAGALDHFGGHRAALMASLPGVIEAVEQSQRDLSSGQNDLFGGVQEQVLPDLQLVQVPEWSDEQRLHGERETLGLFLSGHPIDGYEDELRQFVDRRISELQPDENRSCRLAGLVTGIRTMNSKRGDRIAFVTIEDRSGRVEVGLFGDLYNQSKDHLVQDMVIVVEGNISLDDYGGRLRVRAEKLFDIEQARTEYARDISIQLCPGGLQGDFSGRLEAVLEPYRNGSCGVTLAYCNEKASARIRLGPGWRVKPRNELLQRLGKLDGVAGVEVCYNPTPRTTAVQG